VGDAVPGVAGVVDDDVDAAEGVDRGGDQRVGGPSTVRSPVCAAVSPSIG
jgi:hypothetical protein